MIPAALAMMLVIAPFATLCASSQSEAAAPVATKGGAPIQDIWNERDLTQAQEHDAAEALGVGWYLNYLSTTDHVTPGFVPMVFDHAHATIENVAVAAPYGTLLTFNEPDGDPPQANMTPAQAAADWALLLSGGARLGSPPIAGALTSHPNWLDTFLARPEAPAPEFIVVHRYTRDFAHPAAAAAATMAYLGSVHDYYRKPVWVTELGMIDFISGGAQNWRYPSEAQAIAYITELVPRMNATEWIERFAWYPMTVSQAYIDENRGLLNVRLTDLTGTLTNVGLAYRDAITKGL